MLENYMFDVFLIDEFEKFLCVVIVDVKKVVKWGVCSGKDKLGR